MEGENVKGEPSEEVLKIAVLGIIFIAEENIMVSCIKEAALRVIKVLKSSTSPVQQVLSELNRVLRNTLSPV